MLEETEKKNIEQEEFESEQNLLGLFAILLAVDKRVNPQNYEFQNKQND
ncbi:MAG: hypothetical protein WC603_04025 [Candidatus Paceibacterota bacterium]|jgi:hypothetical protein